MKNSSKGFAPLVLLVIVAVVVVGGGAYYYSQRSQQPNIVIDNKITTTTDQTAGWKTYRNSKDGYEIKYPASGTITERQGCAVVSSGIVKAYIASGDPDCPLITGADGLRKDQTVKIEDKNFTASGLTTNSVSYFKVKYSDRIKFTYFIGPKINGEALTAKEIEEASAIAQQILSTFKIVATDAQSNTSNWKTYVNTKYGFQFSYPQGLTRLQEYPNGQDCKQTKVWKNTSTSVVTTALINNISVQVVCEALQRGGAQLFSMDAEVEPTTITVADRTAYQYETVTATGYTWKVVQIPLSDENKYVELSYTYGNSYRLNKNGYELSNKEWGDILASFKIGRLEDI